MLKIHILVCRNTFLEFWVVGQICRIDCIAHKLGFFFSTFYIVENKGILSDTWKLSEIQISMSIENFIGAQPHLFIYTLSVAAFVLY